MTKRMKETVECLRALRTEMHNAAETCAVEELDWAIEQIENETAVTGDEDNEASRQRCLSYLGTALRYLPFVIDLFNHWNH